MDERYNHEHYRDTTPHQAERNIERDNLQRVSIIVHLAKEMFKKKGFEVVERIVLKDCKTGRIYR